MRDYEGIRLVFEAIRGRFSRLGLVWADGMYERVAGWIARRRPARPIRREVVKRGGPGFKVLERRRVVERTLAWLGRCRRLSEDSEETIESSEAFVKLGMIPPMARRLVKRLNR